MLTNEQRAHDLAVLFLKSEMEKGIVPINTDMKKLTGIYVAHYSEIIAALNSLLN